jgi:hypothetical protein
VPRARAAIHRFLDREFAHDGNRFYQDRHGETSPFAREPRTAPANSP